MPPFGNRSPEPSTPQPSKLMQFHSIPEMHDTECAPPVSPQPLWQRLRLRELALCILTFHLGFFSHLFFKELEPDPPIMVNTVAPTEAVPFSIEALSTLVESMPEDGFRACLQMVIGTAYADRCDELLAYSVPFLDRVLAKNANATDAGSPPSRSEAAKPDDKPRKRVKPKRLKRANPGSGQFLTSIDPES
jgi:hypothetical protein